MTISINRRASIARPYSVVLRLAVFATAAAALFAQPTAQAASRSADPRTEAPRQHATQTAKELIKMSENETSSARPK